MKHFNKQQALKDLFVAMNMDLPDDDSDIVIDTVFSGSDYLLKIHNEAYTQGYQDAMDSSEKLKSYDSN